MKNHPIWSPWSQMFKAAGVLVSTLFFLCVLKKHSQSTRMDTHTHTHTQTFLNLKDVIKHNKYKLTQKPLRILTVERTL
jgi:hypothetical protein